MSEGYPEIVQIWHPETGVLDPRVTDQLEEGGFVIRHKNRIGDYLERIRKAEGN